MKIFVLVVDGWERIQELRFHCNPNRDEYVVTIYHRPLGMLSYL